MLRKKEKSKHGLSSQFMKYMSVETLSGVSDPASVFNEALHVAFSIPLCLLPVTSKQVLPWLLGTPHLSLC